MNKTYCISDLHGHFNILLAMLDKIHFDETDNLYILGDCNDRGSFAYEIYDYVFSHSKNIHLLKGNHELMMRDMLISGSWNSPDGRLWGHNGGKKTLEQLKAHHYIHNASVQFEEYTKNLVNKINECPNFIELEISGKKYVLIHSGINPEKGLYEQDEEECCWMREFFYLSKGLEDKTIIFGHTPTILIDSSLNHGVWKDPIYEDKVAIDGGLGNYSEGQLNCLCLNDMSIVSIKKKDVEE